MSASELCASEPQNTAGGLWETESSRRLTFTILNYVIHRERFRLYLLSERTCGVSDAVFLNDGIKCGGPKAIGNKDCEADDLGFFSVFSALNWFVTAQKMWGLELYREQKQNADFLQQKIYF